MDLPKTVVSAIDNLLFRSRVEKVADHFALPVQTMLEESDILQAVESGRISLLLLDLALDGVDGIELIRRVVEQRRKTDSNLPAIVAFTNHIKTDILEAARMAGADMVIPNSVFAAKMNTIIGTFAGQNIAPKE